MGWNRNHAARLLHGEERALFEASLPERAHALSDRQLLASAQKLRRTRERLQDEREPKAQMLGEALLRVEQEASRRKIAGPETQNAPRAGRTGGLGSRAEKPSEGTQGRTAKAQPRPGRSSKSPNAASQSAAGSDKPQAQKARGKGDGLPAAARDSAG